MLFAPDGSPGLTLLCQRASGCSSLRVGVCVFAKVSGRLAVITDGASTAAQADPVPARRRGRAVPGPLPHRASPQQLLSTAARAVHWLGGRLTTPGRQGLAQHYYCSPTRWSSNSRGGGTERPPAQICGTALDVPGQ